MRPRFDANAFAKGAMHAAILLSLGSCSQCGDGPAEPSSATSVLLTPQVVRLFVGGETQLSVAARAANGALLSGRKVEWRSSETGVATVSSLGYVQAVAVGRATVTATVDGISSSADVTVELVPVAVIAVSPASASIYVGRTMQLQAIVKDSAGNTLTGRPILWQSTDSTRATVSATGLVSALSSGLVQIRASSGTAEGMATVHNVQIPQYTLTVRTTPGVTGIPIAGTIRADSGTTVPYSFQLAEGFEDLRVFQDTNAVTASGSVQLNGDVTLTATGNTVPVPPLSAAPIGSALGQLLTASDPTAAARSLSVEYERLIVEHGLEEATRQFSLIVAATYDPVADAAALASAFATMIETAAASEFETPASKASTTRNVGQESVTPILYINGVLTSPEAYVGTVSSLQSVLQSAGVPPESLLRFYNRSWRASLSQSAESAAICLDLLSNQVSLGMVSSVFRVPDCLDSFSVGDLPLGDLPEAYIQIIRGVYGSLSLSNQPDAIALASKIQSILSQYGRLVVIAHSQGNLVLSEAIRELQGDDAPTRCLGIVSIAAPMTVSVAGTAATIDAAILEGSRSKDILLYWPNLNDGDDRITNALTGIWDDRLGTLSIARFWGALVGGMDIHSIERSYLGRANSREWIRAAILHQRDRVETDCPVTTVQIDVSMQPIGGGAVEGAGPYEIGDTVVLRASPAAGYEFVAWTEGGAEVSTDPTYTFVATVSRALVATFRERTVTTYTIDIVTSPVGGGTVSGSGTYAANDLVRVTATAAAGFTFLRWVDEGVEVETDVTYEFRADRNRTLVAVFESIVLTYSIVLSASPAEGGTVTGGGVFAQNSQVNATAHAAVGYAFAHWAENGVAVSNDNPYFFNAGSDRTLVAIFSPVLNPVISEQTLADMWSENNAGSMSQYMINTPLEGTLGRLTVLVKWTGTQNLEAQFGCYTGPNGTGTNSCTGPGSIVVPLIGTSNPEGEYIEFDFSPQNWAFDPTKYYILQVHNQNVCTQTQNNNCITLDLPGFDGHGDYAALELRDS